MTLILWPAMTRQGAHKVEPPGRVLVEPCSQMEGGLLRPRWLIVAVFMSVGVFMSGWVTLFSSCFFPCTQLCCLVCFVMSLDATVHGGSTAAPVWCT